MLPQSLTDAACRLAMGTCTSRDLVEACLGALDRSANAQAAFLSIDPAAVQAQADQADIRWRSGIQRSPFDGVPISIKDSFDVAGQVTTAGSTILRSDPPATDDALSLVPLRQAGFLFLGRTHMTEFAYSGLGLNAHYPDPTSIWRGQGLRVPGGSSSGAAVSVAEGAALAAIGSDTGGSCRIPAAFNRLTGFKPTARRVSMIGMVPLSPSLDSVGSVGHTVACCDLLDRLMSSEPRPVAQPVRHRRLLLPTDLMLNDLDVQTAEAFERALHCLSAAGFGLVRRRVAAFDVLPELTSRGGLTAIEAMRYHRPQIARGHECYDIRTLARLSMGDDPDCRRHRALTALRVRLIDEMNLALADCDALVAPTVPVIAPLMSDCLSNAAYNANNLLVLRNPSIANLMDGCSISLPLRDSAAPVGLMLTARAGDDAALLSLGQMVEKALGV